MFGKFSEQLKSTTKPVHTLFAVNTKTLESLSQHQTTLFTGLLSDSVRYIEAVTKQTEFKGVMTANSELAESVRERMTSASKGTYSTLNAMREEMTEVMAASLATATEETKETVEKATAAVKKTTKAAAPKKAAPEAAKAPVEAAEKVAEATKETVEKAAEETKAVAEEAKEATAEAKPAAAAKKPATRTRRTTAKKTATTTKSTS